MTVAASGLAEHALVAGFAEPVHDGQASFRALLEAMAHPGRIVTLPVSLAAPPPAPLDAATAAVLLTLLDGDTPLWLAPAALPAAAYLRFHCGCSVVAAPGAARFAFVPLGSAPPPLDAFDLGSETYPDRSATLVLGVAGLVAGTGLSLSGPGIAGRAALAVAGLDPGFWAQRRALETMFPRGLDLVLTSGARLAALPRSTRLEV